MTIARQAEVQQFPPPLSRKLCSRVSRIHLGRKYKVWESTASQQSPFRGMEWKSSVDGAISYPSEKIQAWAFSSWFPVTLSPWIPHVCSGCTHVSEQTLARTDLWLRGHSGRIKHIACMCFLFTANTNEKWAHPLSLGFALLFHFLSPCTAASLFLTAKHLERVTVTTQPQESQVSAPQDHVDLEKTLRTRTTVGVREILFMPKLLNSAIYIFAVTAPSGI